MNIIYRYNILNSFLFFFCLLSIPVRTFILPDPFCFVEYNWYSNVKITIEDHICDRENTSTYRFQTSKVTNKRSLQYQKSFLWFRSCLVLHAAIRKKWKQKESSRERLELKHIMLPCTAATVITLCSSVKIYHCGRPWKQY